ncbi:NnrU family protein [Loktanella sp. Alg231-35]|uniref:NnrU family protein n=1 Tax=Loktanella sp. Alg231-35 TaxID=1922220 RepID=UPI000D560B3D|nr:NnrU family protein [Loktanella sp. Alg231-35]
MTLLVLGVALWWAAHLFKRVVPARRAVLGAKGSPIVALAILVSVVLMVLGYRMAEGTVYWGRTPMWVGINNLLMVVAFYFYAASAAQGQKIWLGTKVRHPQLTGFSIWAIAHLLVNGDTPSFILFGGLLVWAAVEVIVINAQEGPWDTPERAPAAKEVVSIIITLGVVCVVMFVHYLLGVTPWG